MASASNIYALACVKTGEIRYIGKANNPEQRLKSHMSDSLRRDTPLYRWIRKHGKPELIVVEKNCTDWKQAERGHIKRLRDKGFRLLNVADGGDQPFCSRDVRSQNAKKATLKRSQTLWRLYLSMGRNKAWAEKTGRTALAEKLENAVARLKEAEATAREQGTLPRLESKVQNLVERLGYV